MKRKLIIDGNAVYEIDEDCMVKRRLDGEETGGNAKENRTDKEKNSEAE